MRSISSTPSRTSFIVSQMSGSGAANGPAALGVGGRASSMASTWPPKPDVSSVHGVAVLVCHAPITAKASRARDVRALAEPDAQRVVARARRRDGYDWDGVAVDVGDDTLIVGVADF